jgi:hypothetical protein
MKMNAKRDPIRGVQGRHHLNYILNLKTSYAKRRIMKIRPEISQGIFGLRNKFSGLGIKKPRNVSDPGLFSAS